MLKQQSAMRVPGAVLLLDSAAVRSLLTLDECISAVEAAFLAHYRGQSLSPGLMHVDALGGEFHIKAGGLRGPRTYFACKVNGSFFGNRSRNGLPNILGLILLCDGANGSPLAAMDSRQITALRTGAATAVAAKYLARRDTRVVTICGAGKQASIQLRALCKVLPIEQAFVWSRTIPDPAYLEQLAEDLGIEVRAAAELQAATEQSSVVVTCTPAMGWFLGRQHITPGTFIAAIGADSPDKQELEPGLLAENSVVCDLTEQCSQVGDLHHALEAGLMTRNHVRGELGAVIAGSVPGRSNDEEVIVFDSTGTALQDAASAAAVYEKAVVSKAGTEFSFCVD